MKALMMDTPLKLDHLLERAARLFPGREIVTRTNTGPHRTSYAEVAIRARQIAGALQSLGVKPGDRVGTFAWNSQMHLELYFGIPLAGAVLHTLNIRLFAEQIAYIVNHAADRFIFVDDLLLPLLDPLRDQLSSVEAVIVMGDNHQTDNWIGKTMRYQDLLEMGSACQPTMVSETDAAAMCYTSGTTGNPKGVLYSHRALVLQSIAQAMTDVFALRQSDTVMPVVPMFHANAWALPYSATLVGAKQVFPSRFMASADIVSLIEGERVTVAAGVPTVWTGVLELLSSQPHDLSSLSRVICGGAAVPASMIEAFDRLGITLIQAWGMTETSPLGTVGVLKQELKDLPYDEQVRVRAKQGIAVPTLETRVVMEDGSEAPWDGKTLGELQVKGPWVASAYYNDDRSQEAFSDGWFGTGDIANIDSEGYVQVVDRAKDLIKSGGEWISSVDLENAIVAHPKVLEAAVIAVPHPKWQERPLACVVPRPGHRDTIDKEEIYDHLSKRFAKWWLPDDILFLDELPKTSVGKVAKRLLRERFSKRRADG